MGETIRVRDHGRPCEHGSHLPHWLHASQARWWREPDCPGGREMVLRSVGAGVWEEVEGRGETGG